MNFADTPVLFAGTYRGGGGEGLHAIAVGDDGQLRLGEVYDGAPNASFSAQGARLGLHYIVDETDPGSVGVHRWAAGVWKQMASVAAGGAMPCHVALDRSETWLAVANYGSGSVALIRLDAATGLPCGAAQVHAHRGSGPNAARQEGPHAHWVGFSDDGRWLYQTDLGTDEILAFAIDQDAGLGACHIAYRAPPGSGPRHLVPHPHLPHRAYLASELANTLTVLRHADGRFDAPQIMSTLPDGWRGESIVGHIAPNRAATRLYVSNRGHDSIAVFALDAAGHPTLLQHVASGGAFPRFFLLLEERGLMVVAHEKSQTVSALAIAADGWLSPVGPPLAISGVGYLLKP